MSGAVRTEEQRARMNALYARLRRASEGLFWHGGEMHWGCPPGVVRAYVVARVEGGDLVEACLVAHFGREALNWLRSAVRYGAVKAAQAWAWKLASIEAAA